MEKTKLSREFHKKKLKGIVLDELKWAIEIICILIIFIGLLTISGLTVSDMFNFIGSGLTDIFIPIFNAIVGAIVSFFVAVVNAFTAGLSALVGFFTNILCGILPIC